MDKTDKNIFNRAKQVKLFQLEKNQMRAGLELFIQNHPVRNAETFRHLLQERSKSHISIFREIGEILTLKPLINNLKPMNIAIIIALILSGGTSFAAEGALPGDLLFPIKVGINEELRSFVAFSNEAQASWDGRRAERRLEEAEKLATEGRLDAETKAKIESQFKSHAEAFEEHAEKIETRQDSRGSLEARSNFEASLKAHEQVLAQIANEKADARVEVESLLLTVRTKLNVATRARGNTEAKVSAEANGQFKAAAEGKLRAAENKISEVGGYLERVKSSVSAEAHLRAEARLKIAAEVIARGKGEIEAETYGKAFVSFQEAIRIAQEAKLLIEGEDRINLEIKVPGLNVRLEGGNQTDILERMDGKTKVKSEKESSSGSSFEVESESRVETGNGSAKVESEGKLKIDVGL